VLIYQSDMVYLSELMSKIGKKLILIFFSHFFPAMRSKTKSFDRKIMLDASFILSLKLFRMIS